MSRCQGVAPRLYDLACCQPRNGEACADCPEEVVILWICGMLVALIALIWSYSFVRPGSRAAEVGCSSQELASVPTGLLPRGCCN